MNVPGFSQDATDLVNQMLYAEGQVKPLAGQCNQREKMKKTNRTQEQQNADRARSQANSGKDKVPASTRSAAAKKAAETRAKCKGLR